MKEYRVTCRVLEHSAGEPTKAYTLYSNPIESWNEVDASWIFLDFLLEKLSDNVYFIDPCVVKVA